MYVYKILHTNSYVPPPPCPRWGKSVLRVKTHASESGRMHPAICGQVIKKKMHRVSAQMYLQTTIQDGVLRIHPQLLFFFAAKVQISTSESGPKWRFRTRQAAATFSFPMHKYGRSFFLFYIEKMVACNFLSAMKILICYGTAEIYVRLFGTV